MTLIEFARDVIETDASIYFKDEMKSVKVLAQAVLEAKEILLDSQVRIIGWEERAEEWLSKYAPTLEEK